MGIIIETRRDFLKKAAYLTAGAATLPMVGAACASTEKTAEKEIGVQLWSVRNQLEADFDKTISEIAAIGFDHVEAFGLSTSGIFPGLITPNQYEHVVKSAGMRIASCHSSYFTPEDAPTIIESAKRLETDWVIIAWLAEDMRNGYYEHAENMNKIGEQFKAAGIGFGYHNHEFEFFETEEGEIPLEIMIENTDPDLVKFQADLYWIKKAGVDPLGFVQKYPGRFCSYHVKDADMNLDQTTVGDGIIDFESILKENSKTGVEFVFVEDERTDTPIENVKNGYNHVKNLNY
jgi:sugar phosphate isomerase/epimerase